MARRASPPRTARVLVGGFAIAVLALAFVAWRWALSPSSEGVARTGAEAGAGGAALRGRADPRASDPPRDGPDPIDPFEAPRAPVSTATALAGLSARLDVTRRATLEAIVVRGGAGPEVLAAVEALVASDNNTISWWATAAAMRLDGDRRRLRTLAEAEAALPGRSPGVPGLPGSLVLRLDPVAGDALLRAVAEDRSRKARALAGLDAALDALVAGTEPGGRAVASAIGEAASGDVETWLAIARGLRPVPPAVLHAVLARLESGQPLAAVRAAAFLSDRSTDLAAAGDSLDAWLLDTIDKPPSLSSHAARAVLARLPAVSPAVLDRVVGSPDGGAPVPLAARLATLGPRARPAAGALLSQLETVAPEDRASVVRALASIGGADVADHAARHLGTADAAERDAWLAGAAALGPEPAWLDALGRLAKDADAGLAARAVGAAAAADPEGGAGSATVLRAALDDPRAPVRAAAVAAVASRPAIDGAAADALSRALDDADASVRARAVEAVATAYRRGPGAAALAPALVRLARDASVARPGSATRDLVLRSVATLAPMEGVALDVVRRAASEASFDARRAALLGFSRLARPTADDAALVRRLRDADRRLEPVAAEILERPAWAAFAGR